MDINQSIGVQPFQTQAETTQTQMHPSPESILQMGLGFWPSKIVLTAVKFNLFTLLANNTSLPAADIKARLNLQCTDRHVYDFLDALTAFGFLHRDGLLENATYTDSLNTNVFLDKQKPSYLGGILEMANSRLYRFWGGLENGLLSGLPQNEAKDGNSSLFEEVFSSTEKLTEFLHAMSGLQTGNFMAFAKTFDFSDYRTLTDAGGASAALSIMVAKHHPHMQCLSFDLPPVEPIAKKNICQFSATANVKTASGDFFVDSLSKADVVVMGNILHDWSESQKLSLMQKAYDALPANGAFVAIENVIDDNRSQNVFGMMMSLNMLIETGVGFDYTFADFTKWANTIGFRKTALLPLTGPASAAIAYK